MSKKQHKIYTIKMSDWVFFDPEFKKKYTNSFPLSRTLINHKCMDFITDTEFRLLIGLLEVCYSSGKGEVKVDERLFKANGKVMERSLTKLEQFQILTFSINKEIKEIKEVKETNKEIDLNILLPKQDQKEFIEKLTTFVTAEMGSIDTGFIKHYWKRIYDAFLSYEGFYEFVEQIYEGKTFSSIEKTISQKSYFKKALDAELSRREGKDGK